MMAAMLCGLSAAAQVPSYLTPAYPVHVEQDVVYGTAVGYRSHTPDNAQQHPLKLLVGQQKPQELTLLADIYTPEEDGAQTRPLLLMMHGGAFLFGNKNEPGQTEWCRHFASLGYVAASIDYRLGYRLCKRTYAAAEQAVVEDARQALAYLLGREDLRIDPERVFIAGTSAGAATALSLAFQPPPHDTDYHICAIANCWGYVHDLSVLENASTPILSFQSDQDPVVPYKVGYPMGARFAGKVFGTAPVAERAKTLGIHCEQHPCPEKAHRLHLDKQGQFTPRFYEIRDCMTSFFAQAMPKPLPPPGIIHGDAVEASVSGEECPAIQDDDIPAGESLL